MSHSSEISTCSQSLGGSWMSVEDYLEGSLSEMSDEDSSYPVSTPSPPPEEINNPMPEPNVDQILFLGSSAIRKLREALEAHRTGNKNILHCRLLDDARKMAYKACTTSPETLKTLEGELDFDWERLMEYAEALSTIFLCYFANGTEYRVRGPNLPIKDCGVSKREDSAEWTVKALKTLGVKETDLPVDAQFYWIEQLRGRLHEAAKGVDPDSHNLRTQGRTRGWPTPLETSLGSV